MDWQFSDAKNKLGQLMSKARSEGPQRVLYHGQVLIVIAEQEYKSLSAKRHSFKEFLRNGPGLEEVDLTRDRSPMRDVKF